jgi:hypothetical protein
MRAAADFQDAAKRRGQVEQAGVAEINLVSFARVEDRLVKRLPVLEMHVEADGVVADLQRLGRVDVKVDEIDIEVDVELDPVSRRRRRNR